MDYNGELISLVTLLLSEKSEMIKFSLNKSRQMELLKETQFLETLFPEKKIPLKVRCLVVSSGIKEENYPRCPLCGSPVSWDSEYQASFNQFCSDKCRIANKRLKRPDKLSDKDWLIEQKITLNRSYDDIGKELGVSACPVSHACEQFGIGEKQVLKKKPVISKEDLQERLLDQTKTIEEIAESLDTSRYLLHQLSRELGILKEDQSFIELRFGCKSSFGTIPQRQNYQKTCLQKYGFPYIPICHMTKTSKVEKSLRDFVRELLGDESITKSRKVLLPEFNGEVDIWIPDHNLAIEVNGIYWHSEKRLKDKTKHFKKFDILSKKGIQLLQFWDMEIHSKESIVHSLLTAKCGKSQNVVPARKTRVVEIPFQVANKFHLDNHLQGAISSTQGIVNLGLAFNDELVAVISLGNHHRQVKQTVLSRLTFKKGFSILGGSEKLFKHAIQSVSQRPIVTFSDNRISLGKVYERLGFTKDKTLPPDYLWINKDEMLKKQTADKAFFLKRGGTGTTEVECAESLGFHQVFDAGKVRWKFKE